MTTISRHCITVASNVQYDYYVLARTLEQYNIQKSDVISIVHDEGKVWLYYFTEINPIA